MSESEIIEAVEEAKKPGVFNIVDVVKDRGYPRLSVDVFIDEDIAYTAADIDARVKEYERQMDKKNLSPKELAELNSKRDEYIEARDKLVSDMAESKYVFHIRGISEGQRELLEKKAYERYPIKYELDRNPLTGDAVKRELESPDRQKLFTTLLWSAHIEKIVSPSGDEQVGLSVEEAHDLRANLPLASISRVTEAIDKIRASTALFMLSVNEDFLAKS